MSDINKIKEEKLIYESAIAKVKKYYNQFKTNGNTNNTIMEKFYLLKDILSKNYLQYDVIKNKLKFDDVENDLKLLDRVFYYLIDELEINLEDLNKKESMLQTANTNETGGTNV